MRIFVASLTLRFYIRDGWTVEKLKSYLVNKKSKIVYRSDKIFPEFDYLVVYDKSGYKIFTKKLLENEFESKFNGAWKKWYIK